MFRKKLLVLITILFFFLNTSYAVVNQVNNSQQLDANEVSKLAKEIKLLQAQIANLDTQKITDDIVVGLGSQQKVSNDQFNDFDKSTKVREQYLQQQVSLSSSDDREVDVGNQVKITTQGEISYVGSFSSNNTVPIGQLPSNLFASSILRQRAFFDDYSIFFGGFIQADAQIWNGTDITTRNGGNFTGNGENIYLTSATLYFLANLGHYVTANLDFVANQNNNYDLQDAFVIFGNLDTTPVFVSVGKYRPSVGSFGGGGPWTSGITANMFRPLRVTNAAINYRGDTSNANFTVFDAKNHATFSVAYFDAVSIPNIAQVGFNLGYMHDIRGANNRFNFIDKRVGEFNIDTAISFESIPFLPGNLNVGAGWATTTTQSTQFNGRSNAFAGAFTVQAAYTFKLFGSGQNINASYGHSYNADNIPMPLSAGGSFFLAASGIKDQILVSTQRSFFDDNVLIGPEYSWQSLYNGQRMNTLTLDLSVYI
ncbi:hypothetical protein DR79_637 [Francisella tularensis]|uniref:DUF3573 domain-containing protein n=5 Tax=Francisella tularensis TaxID=263 RepID=Q5NGC6_FRATT|nr:DUF3573 domain-containing protein [Francisella tularensis]AAV29065.1 NT02FT0620 [synthetic construct]ADA78599.1 hypothetical protein NE061598_05260 [Francisella tularensis subsp. tularensis NE061598]AFB79016.1 hypothetical protein FTU_0958 [Francisella tularensis subsp. tularensis TIGB03]AFB80561.1 hypothetical protein FTV_0874 [Francisella tularensis subsp. tularensis TI0902]AJI69290.1 hypothetical protein BZ14_1942 [Francisella tularensis subsp. tularensis SCHU S4]